MKKETIGTLIYLLLITMLFSTAYFSSINSDWLYVYLYFLSGAFSYNFFMNELRGDKK